MQLGTCDCLTIALCVTIALFLYRMLRWSFHQMV